MIQLFVHRHHCHYGRHYTLQSLWNKHVVLHVTQFHTRAHIVSLRTMHYESAWFHVIGPYIYLIHPANFKRILHQQTNLRQTLHFVLPSARARWFHRPITECAGCELWDNSLPILWVRLLGRTFCTLRSISWNLICSNRLLCWQQSVFS